MTNDVTDTLKTIVSDALEIEVAEVTGELCSKNCPKWDSVRHVSIIMMIEEQFDIEFDDADFSKMTDFSHLAAMVEEKIAAS